MSGPIECAVIDIETRPDRFARMIASEKGSSRSVILVEIANASVLAFTLSPSGSASDFALTSYHADEYSEADIVANIALKVRSAIASGGEVVTYNGSRFDIPLLRLRMMRWWSQFSRHLGELERTRKSHRDMMVAFAGPLGKPPSLKDCCAMLGFSIHGPIDVFGANPVPPQQRKCECDVVGTAILYFYTLAERHGVEALQGNLAALGEFLRVHCAGLPHLARLGSDSLLCREAGPWRGSCDGPDERASQPRRGRPPRLLG